MDRSRHSITKYLNDEKTHKAINEPLFKRLNKVEKDLNTKLRMLELYYNFFNEFCDVNKFEELEMDTDSLYLALAEEKLYDCIKPDKRAAWEKIRENDWRLFQGECTI